MQAQSLQCPPGYEVRRCERHNVYRLWRLFDTDDGYPDEIEDGYATRAEAVEAARQCAGIAAA